MMMYFFFFSDEVFQKNAVSGRWCVDSSMITALIAYSPTLL